MGGSVTSGGYVEVYSAPYAYNRGGQADGEDSKCSPLLGLSNPQIRRIAGSGGIGCRVLHLFYGSVLTICSAKGDGANSCKEPGLLYTALTTERPFICESIVCITFSVCAIRVVITCIQVHVTCSFNRRLALELGFIAATALSRRIPNPISNRCRV